ncbi:MAG: magnesium and cobalt transport protein CorA [Candidatus Methylopumilus sp.]|nr:magnesium and cobalt transport protein CorA [Candidatus Methylopumilus sp.]
MMKKSVKAANTSPDMVLDNMSEVIASRVYFNGRRSRSVELDDLSKVITEPEALVWIGLKEPDEALLVRVALQLGLEPHVLDDMQARHRMPKVMDYDSVVLVVAMTVEVSASDGLPVFGETQMLIGPSFLLTIRRGALAPHTELRNRLENMPDRLARGSDFVAVELLDLLLDRYNLASDMFEKTIEPMEQTMLLRGFEKLKVKRLYHMRRDFHKMHNAISPLGEVCRRLAHIEMAPIDAQARVHFGELADRVSRVDRLLDNLGDGLTFAFEAGMMIEQAKQTETTRRLAAWAAILAVPTAIAGVYGMNFENMPELKWEYGYHFVVGGMATICGTLYYQFRKAKWL